MNTSPALFRHGAVLTDLLPRVIEEICQKVVDPIFPPPEGASRPGPTLDDFVPLEIDLGRKPTRRVGLAGGSAAAPGAAAEGVAPAALRRVSTGIRPSPTGMVAAKLPKWPAEGGGAARGGDGSAPVNVAS